MVAPRKHRNMEERTAICEEVYSKLQQLLLTGDEQKEIEDVLKTFLAQTGGQTLQGVIDLKSIGCQIEYVLPGRRVLPHFMRILQKPQQTKA